MRERHEAASCTLGPTLPSDSIADLNGDTIVGPADLVVILSNWWPCL